MRERTFRPIIAAALLAAVLPFALVLSQATPVSAGSRSHGKYTMVSANKDGSDSAATPGGTFGADQAAISDDGKVVAFVSKSPAETLVNDPVQLAAGTVTDTNNVEDVFVWDSRVPAPVGPVVTLVSWNKTHTGTGDGASQHPIMAPLGIGVVYESGADDLVTVPVGSFSKHLYAWLPLVSDIFPNFMVDQKFDGSAGADSLSS